MQAESKTLLLLEEVRQNFAAGFNRAVPRYFVLEHRIVA